MAVDDGVTVEVQCFDGPHVEHLLMQHCYLIIRGIDLAQIRQLLYAAEAGQFVILQVDLFEHGELRDVDGQLG